jgi:hypothetical protein
MLMSTRLLALFAVLGLFGALTLAALLQVGYIGVFAGQFQNWGTRQVLADLVLMGLLCCGWMVPDAKGRGINPWPFVLVTLVGGSFGPLFYLVRRELKAKGDRSPAA